MRRQQTERLLLLLLLNITCLLLNLDSLDSIDCTAYVPRAPIYVCFTKVDRPYSSLPHHTFSAQLKELKGPIANLFPYRYTMMFCLKEISLLLVKSSIALIYFSVFKFLYVFKHTLNILQP